MKIVVLSNLAQDIYNNCFDINKIEALNNAKNYIETFK